MASLIPWPEVVKGQYISGNIYEEHMVDLIELDNHMIRPCPDSVVF